MSHSHHQASNERQRLAPIRIERLPSFTVAGLQAVTSNAKEMSGQGQIGRLWEQFGEPGRFRNPPDGAEYDGNTYGCYFDYEDGDAGSYTVMAGLQWRSGAALPPGFDSVAIPSADYAVFETECGPLRQVVGQAWEDIWHWSRQPGNSRAFTGDFEVYDERCADPERAVVQIYIAVKYKHLA